MARRSSRHRKHQKSEDDVDRLSKLPDSVISHILSFLPTEVAVATIMISKRYKFPWMDVHTLFFSDVTFKDSKVKFSHFVSKVLMFLNQQSIEEFYLKIEEYSEMYDVTTWVATAVARNVKRLEFRNEDNYSSYSDPHAKLPSSIFTCRTLECLVLKGIASVYIPSSVCLPNLKSLFLGPVNFECDESVRNLISGCPVLDTLYVQRTAYDNVVTFSVSSLTLTKLYLRFTDVDRFPQELHYKLELNAPELKHFYLRDELSKEFFIENLCSLDDAIIRTRLFKDDKEWNDYPNVVVKLLQGLSNVKHLTLHPSTIEALSRVDLIPSFPRLTDFEAQYCGWSLLLKLAEGMNNLEVLTLSQMNASLSGWSKPKKVPICFLSCLQKMSIAGFSGQADELALVAYISKNCKVLKTIIINAYRGLDLEARYQLLQEVLKFPRGCEECEVTFSTDLESFRDNYSNLNLFTISAYFDFSSMSMTSRWD